MRTSRAASRIGLAAILVLALPALALGGQPRTHDGFFLRLSGGGGYGKTSSSPGGIDVDLSGATGDVNIAIGGIVAPNLALHGTLLSWAASDPDVTVENLAGNINGDLTVSGLAGGVTYYFMPSNLYVSGSVGVGSVSLDLDAGPSGETDAGVIGDVTVGKEWWVGDSWGLGLAAGFGFHSVPDKNTNDRWNGTSFSLRFSATLN